MLAIVGVGILAGRRRRAQALQQLDLQRVQRRQVLLADVEGALQQRVALQQLGAAGQPQHLLKRPLVLLAQDVEHPVQPRFGQPLDVPRGDAGAARVATAVRRHRR